MKCNRCGNFVETAGEVRACGICTHASDLTARQIPAELNDATAIERVILAAPGLANRFVLGHAPVLADVKKDPEAERILRDKRAQASAEADIANGTSNVPLEELKRQKIEQELREERERTGTNNDDAREREAEQRRQQARGERDAREQHEQHEQRRRETREANERLERQEKERQDERLEKQAREQRELQDQQRTDPQPARQR